MTSNFTASSGNRCVLRTVTINARSGTNVTWDRNPSDQDIRECTDWHTQMLANEYGRAVTTLSIRESDSEVAAKILKSHLGGGNG